MKERYPFGDSTLHTRGNIGAKKIGHMGFFRAEHRDALWRGAAEWLQAE